MKSKNYICHVPCLRNSMIMSFDKEWSKMTRKSVSHTPYLRKHTSYDHDFWDTCKMMTSPGAFFIFSKFCFLGCWRGKRAKNGPKWQKKYVSLTRYLRNCTPYDCNFWYSFVKWWYLQWFFSFFSKFWFFRFLGE